MTSIEGSIRILDSSDLISEILDVFERDSHFINMDKRNDKIVFVDRDLVWSYSRVYLLNSYIFNIFIEYSLN